MFYRTYFSSFATTLVTNKDMSFKSGVSNHLIKIRTIETCVYINIIFHTYLANTYEIVSRELVMQYNTALWSVEITIVIGAFWIHYRRQNTSLLKVLNRRNNALYLLIWRHARAFGVGLTYTTTSTIVCSFYSLQNYKLWSNQTEKFISWFKTLLL